MKKQTMSLDKIKRKDNKMGGFLITNMIIFFISAIIQTYFYDRGKSDPAEMFFALFLTWFGFYMLLGITIWYYANIWPMLIAQENLGK